MNSFKKTAMALFAVAIPFSLFAAVNEKENVKTIEFKVSGVCEMCEKRIEDAALIKGVKMADWNKEAQKIKVVYRPDKTNEQTIHQAIAKAGHDTEKVKAPADAYNKLHDCCKYREGQAVH
jgi:mercuric ion binding protein